ncbi:MAG: hypothetical protein RL385_1745, partial [Pseudomonadota bacterium]
MERNPNSPTAALSPEPQGGDAAAERNVAVVVNGRARRVTQDIVESLDQILQSGDLYVSRNLEEAQKIAQTIVDRRYRTVLTAGGDGTFVHMVTLIVHAAKERGLAPPR